MISNTEMFFLMGGLWVIITLIGVHFFTVVGKQLFRKDNKK